jgi:hypothetical protein
MSEDTTTGEQFWLAGLNQFQRTAVETYPDGTLILEVGGDSLFTFVISELSDKEDCEDIHDAIERMTVAMSDIEKVRDALVELLPENLAASDALH